MAVGASGNIYVVGNGFIAKFDVSGTVVFNQPLAATPTAVGVDANESVYVTGTASTDFVTTAGAYYVPLSPGTCFSDKAQYQCPGFCS